MKKFSLFFLSFFSSLLSTIGQTPYTLSRLELKYHDHRFVGYNHGYTTLAFFLAPNSPSSTLVFSDLRAHLFNNGELAGNIGLGLRFYDPSETSVITMHGYYDVRQKDSFFSQQLSAGFEILTPHLDIRVNGYKPTFGKYDDEAIKFSRFKRNSFLVAQKVTYAVPMAEIDIGMPLPEPFSQVGLYLGFGGYHLFKQKGFYHHSPSAYGVKARLVAHPEGVFSFGAEASHDALYGTRASGFIALNIPFGKTSTDQKEQRAFLERKTSSPWRNEIIPFFRKRHEFSLGKGNIKEEKILFVNNVFNEKGDGSYETPYQNISEAFSNAEPGNKIYVFAASPYEEQIYFKQGVHLLGSSSNTFFGPIEVPSQTPGLFPIITGKQQLVVCSDVSDVCIEGIHLVSDQLEPIYIHNASGSIKNCIVTSSSSRPLVRVEGINGPLAFLQNQFVSLAKEKGSAMLEIKNQTTDWRGGITLKNNFFKTEETRAVVYLENVFDEFIASNNVFMSKSPEGAAIIGRFSSDKQALGQQKWLSNQIKEGFSCGWDFQIKDNAFIESRLEKNRCASPTLSKGVLYLSDAPYADFESIDDHFIVDETAFDIKVSASEGSISIKRPNLEILSATPAITFSCEGEGKMELIDPSFHYPEKLAEKMKTKEVEAFINDHFPLNIK